MKTQNLALNLQNNKSTIKYMAQPGMASPDLKLGTPNKTKAKPKNKAPEFIPKLVAQNSLTKAISIYGNPVSPNAAKNKVVGAPPKENLHVAALQSPQMSSAAKKQQIVV